jgi:hypothetical protein
MTTTEFDATITLNDHYLATARLSDREPGPLRLFEWWSSE